MVTGCQGPVLWNSRLSLTAILSPWPWPWDKGGLLFGKAGDCESWLGRLDPRQVTSARASLARAHNVASIPPLFCNCRGAAGDLIYKTFKVSNRLLPIDGGGGWATDEVGKWRRKRKEE